MEVDYTTPKITLSRPHPYQDVAYKVFNMPNIRYLVLSNGRRWGKSELLKIIGMQVLIKDGGKVGFMTPKYSYASTFFREYQELLTPYASRISLKDKIIELKNGALIEFFSGDGEGADLIRSRAFHLFLLDEFAYLSDAKKKFERIIEPTLIDYEGKVVIASSPNGAGHFHTLFLRGQIGHQTYDPQYMSFQFPTSTNPYIPIKEIEKAKRNMTERNFRQEFLGEFLLDEAEVFRNLEKVCVLNNIDEPYGSDYVMGADFARENDYTVISILDSVTDQQVYMERMHSIDFGSQIDRIRELYKKWLPVSFFAESNSFGKAILEALENFGIYAEPFYTTNSSKRMIIEQLQLDIEQENILLLNDEIQKNELRNFGLTRTSTNLIKYGASGSNNDDTVIALALANHARRESGSINFAPLPIL